MSELGKHIMIYDISTVPEMLNFDMSYVMKLYREQRLVLYDSTKGNAPTIVNLDDMIKDMEITFVDVSREEHMKKINNYKKILK